MRRTVVEGALDTGGMTRELVTVTKSATKGAMLVATPGRLSHDRPDSAIWVVQAEVKVVWRRPDGAADLLWRKGRRGARISAFVVGRAKARGR